MGLNLPARTVVFAAGHKFDGRVLRPLEPAEYTQMAGRAGRRGLDTQGYAVTLLSQYVDAADGEVMLSRRYTSLRSQFRLRFATMLKAMRTEGVDANTLRTRNLRAWQLRSAHAVCGARRATIADELAALDQSAAASAELFAQADEYLELRAVLHRKATDFERLVRAHCRPWLQPGRVVRLRDARGWAVVISVADPDGGATDGLMVNLLTRGARKRRAPAADGGSGGDDSAAGVSEHGSSEAVEISVVGVPLEAIARLSAIRLWMPRELHLVEARQSVGLALDASLSAFDGEPPLVDPIEDMSIDDPALHALINDIDESEARLRAHSLHGSTAKLPDAYAACVRRRRLRLELRRLDAGRADAAAHTATWPQTPLFDDAARASAMLHLLVQLEHVSDEGVLLLKGRAACCIEGADELLATEVLATNILNGLGVAETVAVLSCLLPIGARTGRPGGSQPLPLPTPALDRAVSAINEAATRLNAARRESGIALDDDGAGGTDGGRSAAGSGGVSVELIPSVLAWANGASFEKAWLLSPKTYEGTLVRALRQLDELLKQLGEAARALGDTALGDKFAEGAKGVHRGIPFSSSLYF